MKRWWDAQPEGEYTCTDCGLRRDKAYVQPQHPSYNEGREGVALCTDCTNRRNQHHREERKRELAAMPRCELCQRRGTFRVGHGGLVLLCGKHKKAAAGAYHRGMGALGGLGLFLPGPVWSREQILAAASGRAVPVEAD